MVKQIKKKWPIDSIVLKLAIFFTLFAGAKENRANTMQDSLMIEQLTDVLREQFRARELDSARVTVDRIKAIASDANMQTKVADCQANYGLIERVKGNPESSVHYYQKAATQYNKIGERASAARAHTAIGQIYLNKQLYQPAFENFSASLELRKSENDSLGMANNLINMGGASYFAGLLDEATDYYLRALRITDDLDNLFLQAQIMTNVGNIHMRQSQHAKAIEYQEQALELHRQLGDSKGESDALLNLGISWYEKGFLELAESYYKESLAIKEALGNDIAGIGKLTNNLGLIARHREDYPAATDYYNTALEMTRKTGDVQTQASILNNLGTVMMNEGNDQALALFQESLEISTRLGLKKLEITNYDNLHQYYSRHGNYEQAYLYLSMHQALNDSLFNLESAARIAELQTIYDTEIKERENQLLKEQSQVLRLRLIIMSVSASSIAVIALALFVLFSLKRKSLRQSKALLEKQTQLGKIEREKNQQEQQHLKDVLFAEEEINRLQKMQLLGKNRELSTSALHMINKNEFLNNVRQTAIKALDSNPPGQKDHIEQLINEIDNNINLDEQWDLFKRHFESVHSGFFSRLRHEFSTLTHNELKLCAYLRMNLSSKEIAQMLNIGVDSAITKRYRLRKKLNLQSDDNLVAFLMKF